MRAIRSKSTKPELLVRRAVHRMGYRYRLHRKDLPGKPDLVFAPRKKVIFVHGCYWHQHGSAACKIARRPKSNQEYWLPKLDRNVQRDREHQAALEEAGWSVLVIWECETADMMTTERRVRAFLGPQVSAPVAFSRTLPRQNP